MAVTGAALASRSAALKFGSESVADMHNITISDVTVRTSPRPKQGDGRLGIPGYALRSSWLQGTCHSMHVPGAPSPTAVAGIGRRVQIRPSHRAIGVQLRDGGNMSAITVRDVMLTANWDAWDWWGAAEAIVISRLRREADQAAIGALHDMTLQNVRGMSEAGVVLVGEPGFPLGHITLRGLWLGMAKLTGYAGGIRDLRPGPWDIEQAAPAALYARHVQHLDVEVRLRPRVCVWDCGKRLPAPGPRSARAGGLGPCAAAALRGSACVAQAAGWRKRGVGGRAARARCAQPHRPPAGGCL